MPTDHVPHLDALFTEVRETRWRTLALFVILHTLLLWLFFSWEFYYGVSAPIRAATRGLVTHALVTNLIELVVLVGGVMLLFGRLRLRDIGLDGAKVLNAVVIVFVLWGLVQLTIVTLGRVGWVPVRWNPNWNLYKTVLLGGPIGAVLGTALVEEVTYRGFFLPQLYLKAQHKWSDQPWRRLVFAVAASQLYFGLNHIPAGFRMHLSAGEMVWFILQVVLVGSLFAFIYLRTDNLFVAMGVHALINDPSMLFVSPLDASLVVLVWASVLLLAWPFLARILHEVFTLRPAFAERWYQAHVRRRGPSS